VTPNELEENLLRVVDAGIDLSLMIWGPPGIGKSSIVAAVADAKKLELVDLRISQLAPTDLRGLPVPDGQTARWLPPEFLPRDGKGILFLDEINLAAPAVQGIAQELVLDRGVGSYRLPSGWFVWAAGNRRDDRAAVFEMPAPLANRFLHFHVEPHLESFLRYAADHDVPELIQAFLAFRPALLHKVDPSQPSWPSPRSWVMAARLSQAGMSIAPAVGAAVAIEVDAYAKVFDSLPSIDAIFAGNGAGLPFPVEPSQRYALTFALSQRPRTVPEAIAGFAWLCERAEAEWARLFAGQILTRMKRLKLDAKFIQAAVKQPALVRFIEDYRALISGS
jgi:MoxR-like ATPase